MQNKPENNIDGFESDGEQDSQELQTHILDQYKESNSKVETPIIMPPPQELINKQYSLKPDMHSGWSPKRHQLNPIPIVFNSFAVDSIIELIHEKNFPNIQLCFLGPRYKNTYYAWYKMPFKYPYSHLQEPQKMKMNNRPFIGQNPTKMKEVIFDSSFETANLDCAIKVGDYEYDLYMRVDSNTKGHLQWYNFKMKNLQKGQKYLFNICNFQKDKTLYQRGMKPYIFSQRTFEREGISWEQAGQNVKYRNKPSKSFSLLELKGRFFYSLSFELEATYENDEMQVAYCVPYSFTDLNNFLNKIREKGHSFYQEERLCLSLGGLQIPLITISQDNRQQTKQLSPSKSPYKNGKERSSFKIDKKCIVISGRVHPGQSNGSYMMEGFISFLCSGNKLAQQLRSKAIFKIVPMLNPDGVCIGNYRTGLSGKDFNRQYLNPDKKIFPEIYKFKELVLENKKIYGEKFLLYLDFHGHSTKKNVFMYGPQFTLADREYYQARIFPKMLAKKTEIFRYFSCIFKISQEKKTTARAIFLRQHKISLSYTMQASNGSYYNPEGLKDTPFNNKLWVKMGKDIGQAMKDYVDLVILSDLQRKQKQQAFRARKEKNNLRQNKLYNRKKSRVNDNKNNQQLKGYQQMFSNDVMKHILDEINFAQEFQEENRKSDDEICQGISDRQSNDDLDPDELNLVYNAIKRKKTPRFASLSKSPQKNDKLHEDFEHPFNGQPEEKVKSQVFQKKSYHSYNESSLKQMAQTKYTNVITLKFNQELKKESTMVKKRPSASLGRKNFSEFVSSQNKREHLTIQRKQSSSTGGTLLNEKILREFSKIRSTSRRQKNNTNSFKCMTIDPVPKY